MLVAATVLIATACASTPNTIANADPGTDFSQFKTFGFYDQLATDKQGYESTESNFLKVAVAQQLDLRGLTYSDDPDLLVNFYIHSEEKYVPETRRQRVLTRATGIRSTMIRSWPIPPMKPESTSTRRERSISTSSMPRRKSWFRKVWYQDA